MTIVRKGLTQGGTRPVRQQMKPICPFANFVLPNRRSSVMILPILVQFRCLATLNVVISPFCKNWQKWAPFQLIPLPCDVLSLYPRSDANLICIRTSSLYPHFLVAFLDRIEFTSIHPFHTFLIAMASNSLYYMLYVFIFLFIRNRLCFFRKQNWMSPKWECCSKTDNRLANIIHFLYLSALSFPVPSCIVRHCSRLVCPFMSSSLIIIKFALELSFFSVR